MRRLFLGVMLLAACGGMDGNSSGGGGSGGGGGGGDNNSTECRQAYSAFHSVVDATQPCTADSDCVAVLDNCFGPAFCSAYVNHDNLAAAQAALADGRQACQCGECSAPPPPACIKGHCGSRIDLCQSLKRDMGDIVAANQSCTQDSDCHFVAELVSDPTTQRTCDTFVNTAGLAQLASLQDRFTTEKCGGTPCADQTPHCTNGSCAAP